MVDDGFLLNGYEDVAGNKLWMFRPSPDIAAARRRRDDLSIVRNGSVSFTTRHVTALRFR
jgi:hypothetical protein